MMTLSSENMTDSPRLSIAGISGGGLLALVIRLLNFAGLPPFGLFYFKAIIISGLALTGSFLQLRRLLLGAVGFVYIYLRLIIRYMGIVGDRPVGYRTSSPWTGLPTMVLVLGPLAFLLLCVI